jgi:hydrogenase maturation protein HypF
MSESAEAVAVDETGIQRARLMVRGVVQGVGFRPFVFRLATELRLNGWVGNTAEGVVIEIEGAASAVRDFRKRFEREKPFLARILSLEAIELDAKGYPDFQIRESVPGRKTALILPDIATCPACLQEINDPANRRFRYPFTNCTHCGPRYSIFESLPYDRANTTMKGFKMCAACQVEYENPRDRRFHAQPNACPTCGPQLELWQRDGTITARGHEALKSAAAAIRDGRIVAVKGVGGFQLMVDARNQDAVTELRRRKHREEKPLALMCPTLQLVQALCEVSEAEQNLLSSTECPIVLLRRRRSGQNDHQIALAVAPGNPNLGVMLPYSPLHHLLMAELGFPVVATSGNLSDEPICVNEQEAITRLSGIADSLLVHNRPIARPVDDSVVRIVADRELVLRRARGYAPLPVRFPRPLLPALAVGAHLKNTVATSVDQDVYVSQHIGDLETLEATRAFERAVEDLQRLHDLRPAHVAADAHPDYRSTIFARRSGLPVTLVQHHYAHVLSCMAENELEPPVLGIAWDGTGYGLDGTIWGGEFLWITEDSFIRMATWRSFGLPGGEAAIKEPRRTALGVLYEILGRDSLKCADLPPVKAFRPAELEVLSTLLERKVQCPRTTSVGRLFDAVASLAGLRQETRFEGQAAMELEFALDETRSEALYPLSFANGTPPISEPTRADTVLAEGDPQARLVLDWEPMIWAILDDVRHGVEAGIISARFHNTMAEAIVMVARQTGAERVALSGGCFQNRYLTERTVARLRQVDIRPYWHQRIPPNDGGIALGQISAINRKGKQT